MKSPNDFVVKWRNQYLHELRNLPSLRQDANNAFQLYSDILNDLGDKNLKVQLQSIHGQIMKKIGDLRK